MVSGEDDDDDDDSDGDDDTLSRYDAAIGLADLPDVCPFLEPIGGVDFLGFEASPRDR
jgi:hypothetical protein